MRSLINPENFRNITKKELAYRASGTFLIERELCKALNVSRTPIREALQQLATEGLVEFIPGKGAFVAGITYEDIIEVYDVREILEGLAVKMFTIHSSESEIEELYEINNHMEQALKEDNIEKLVKYDVAFHKKIIDGCRNNRLKSMINIINDHVERITSTIKKDKMRAKTTVDHHNNIINAIKKRDAALAEQKMREHILNSKNYHLKRFNLTL